MRTIAIFISLAVGFSCFATVSAFPPSRAGLSVAESGSAVSNTSVVSSWAPKTTISSSYIHTAHITGRDAAISSMSVATSNSWEDWNGTHTHTASGLILGSWSPSWYPSHPFTLSGIPTFSHPHASSTLGINSPFATSWPPQPSSSKSVSEISIVTETSTTDVNTVTPYSSTEKFTHTETVSASAVPAATSNVANGTVTETRTSTVSTTTQAVTATVTAPSYRNSTTSMPTSTSVSVSTSVDISDILNSVTAALSNASAVLSSRASFLSTATALPAAVSSNTTVAQTSQAPTVTAINDASAPTVVVDTISSTPYVLEPYGGTTNGAVPATDLYTVTSGSEIEVFSTTFWVPSGVTLPPLPTDTNSDTAQTVTGPTTFATAYAIARRAEDDDGSVCRCSAIPNTNDPCARDCACCTDWGEEAWCCFTEVDPAIAPFMNGIGFCSTSCCHINQG